MATLPVSLGLRVNCLVMAVLSACVHGTLQAVSARSWHRSPALGAALSHYPRNRLSLGSFLHVGEQVGRASPAAHPSTMCSKEEAPPTAHVNSKANDLARFTAAFAS